MKKLFCLLLLAIFNTTTADTAQTSASSTQNIFNVNVNPVMTQANPQTATTTTNVSQQQETKQVVTQDITHHLQFWFSYPTLPAIPLREPLEKAGSHMYAFCQLYKTQLITGSIFGTYLWICYETIRGAQYLALTNLWSSWKRAISLSALHEIPQDVTTRELLVEIQKRYTPSDKPTEFMLPLIHFLYDIDVELKNLHHYNAIGTWLTRVGACHIVPFDMQRFGTTKERIARIAFIKNIFLTWAANYKIEHNRAPLLEQLRRIRPNLMD